MRESRAAVLPHRLSASLPPYSAPPQSVRREVERQGRVLPHRASSVAPGPARPPAHRASSPPPLPRSALALPRCPPSPAPPPFPAPCAGAPELGPGPQSVEGIGAGSRPPAGAGRRGRRGRSGPLTLGPRPRQPRRIPSSIVPVAVAAAVVVTGGGGGGAGVWVG